MATKKPAQKRVKKTKKVGKISFYDVVCNKCHIQLGVRKEDSHKCLLCESAEVSRKPLR
jgi:hypothetical protein